MKILILKFRNIGDVLLATPLIENLKYHYPQSQIDFVLNKECADVITLNPNINEVISYDRAYVKKLSIILQLKAEWQFTKQIKNNAYDLVINLTEGERGAQLVYFSGAKTKLGFAVRKGILSKIKVFDILGNDKKRQHTVEKDLQFVPLLGKDIVSKKVKIYWDKQTEQPVDELLKKYNINHFVHIHPVSRWMFKCWEDDRMAGIIDFFQREKQLAVIITGSSNKIELDRVAKILSLCKSVPLNLAGQLGLKQLAYLSSRAKLFFGVDTAPMHIAAAVDTPVVALFGGSSPSMWGPWNNHSNRKLFKDINGVQSNNRHYLVSNTNQKIIYDSNIKKSVGMTLIDYKTVQETLGIILPL